MIDAVTEREPPIRADADLSQIPDIPIEIEAIRILAKNMHPDAFKAMMLLWCAAWHQLPAGFLPDDDHHIAELAGLAMDDAGALIKASALTGFTRHSDGRLYHHGIVEKALAALAMIEKVEKRKADDRRRQKLHYDRKTGKAPPKPNTETVAVLHVEAPSLVTAAPSPVAPLGNPAIPHMRTAPSCPDNPAVSYVDEVHNGKPHPLNGQGAPTTIARPPHEADKLTVDEWDRVVQKYRISGDWSWRSLGPSPRFDNCRAPSFVLYKHGYGQQAT